MLKVRDYDNALGQLLSLLTASPECARSPYMQEREGKTLLVVIAGDRGLAGGYNANVFRLAKEYPDVLTAAEGLGFLASLQFADAQQAGVFAKKLSGRCIDTSAQLYKANCPPAALFKLPIIMQDSDLDILITAIREVLLEMKETA